MVNYTISLQPAILVCGYSIKLSGSQKENGKLIEKLWQRFNNKLITENIRGGNNWRKYGVSYQKEENYFYMAAIHLRPEYKDFETIEIPGGVYACFQHQGAMQMLKDTFYNIYKKHIPSSDINIDKHRPVLHYELYDKRFNWNKSDSIIDILISII